MSIGISLGTALVALVAFAVPGFTAILVSERAYRTPVRKKSTFELALLTTYYSVLSYGAAALLLSALGFGFTRFSFAQLSEAVPLWKIGVLTLLVFLVVPAFVATITRWWVLVAAGIRRSDFGPSERLTHAVGWLAGRAYEPEVESAWDAFFRQLPGDQPHLLHVQLTNQRSLVGAWDGSSFTGYHAHAEYGSDLVLGRTYDHVDASRTVLRAVGGPMWIRGDKIESILILTTAPTFVGESEEHG